MAKRFKGDVQITSWTGSPPSIKPYGAGGEREPLTRQEVFGSVPTRSVKRVWRSGQQRGHRVTCYHPARVGTGESGRVLSRVEPVAHVSRQLGRVKIARRPVLAGERDVSVVAPDMLAHRTMCVISGLLLHLADHGVAACGGGRPSPVLLPRRSAPLGWSILCALAECGASSLA